MIKTRLKYCVYDPDLAGNPRWYVRKPGKPKVRIRAPFDNPDGTITPEFMKAYWAALSTIDGAEPAADAKTHREQTFNWLCDQYFRSGEFESFDRFTQADKRSVLNRFCATAGELP